MTAPEAKLARIEIGLQAFGDKFLNSQAEAAFDDLWEAAVECPDLNLDRGDPEIWVAAIAYAFARLNYLFDGEGSMHLSRDEFFAFFDGCNKSTVTQKAARIEKALECGPGHPKFCLPEVEDAMPRLVQLPNGMMVPEGLIMGRTANGHDIEIRFMSDEESKEVERLLRDKQRAREEEKARQRLEARRKKRAKERRTQPELFDLGD